MPIKKLRTKEDLKRLIFAENNFTNAEKLGMQQFKKAQNLIIDRAYEDYLKTGRVNIQYLQELGIKEIEKAYKKTSDNSIDLFFPGLLLGAGLAVNKDFLDFKKNEFMSTTGALRSEIISKTVVDKIAKAVQVGKETIASDKEIAKLLLKNKDLSNIRASIIAKREIGFSVNFAEVESCDRIQLETGKQVYKKWLTKRDSKVRRFPDAQFDHAIMEGVIIQKDELFDVQGDRINAPRDPLGQPGNVFNCRCIIAIYNEIK